MVSIRRSVFLAAACLLAMCFGSGPSLAQGRTPTTIRAAVTAAVNAVETDKAVGVDVSVIEEMVQGAVVFEQNFCAPAADAPCRQTVDSPDALRRLAGEHIEALLQRPADAKTFGARIAESVGQDLARAGWPTEAPNPLAVLSVPETWKTARFEFNNSGKVFPAGRTRFLIRPGNVRIVARMPDGSVLEGAKTVGPRTLVVYDGGSAGVAAATLVIDPPDDRFCYSNVPPPNGSPAINAFNWGRATIGESDDRRLANLAPFVRQTALRVSVDDRTGGSCDRACQANLAASFARALATWRSGCGRCEKNALVVLAFGDVVWLDTRLANRLRMRANAPQTSLDLADTVDDGSTLMTAPSFGGTSASIASYRQVNGDAYIKTAVCALNASAAPWVAGAQALMCGAGQSADMKVSPVVALVPGATQCGVATDFLACGIPGAGIELTMDDTRWTGVDASGARYQFGPASSMAFDAEWVVLHEVGHWFGVPHAEIMNPHIKDVMVQSYDVSKSCVSGQSLVFLNNASDLRWTYRITEGGGLRRPPPVNAGRSR